MARRTEVPPEAVAAVGLDRPDYTDAFVAVTTGRPEARAALDAAVAGLPDVVLLPIRAVQRAIGLRVTAPGPERPFGWTLAAQTADRVVLTTDGRLGDAWLVASADDGTLRLVTLLRYGSAASGRVWRVIAPLHRAVVRVLLARAASRLRR